MDTESKTLSMNILSGVIVTFPEDIKDFLLNHFRLDNENGKMAICWGNILCIENENGDFITQGAIKENPDEDMEVGNRLAPLL
jgi:hypothetical protein